MAQPRRGWLERGKDWLERKRWPILYAAALLLLLLALAEWALLPQKVGLRYANGELTALVDKRTAILAHLAICLGCGGLFAKRPRELAYLVGLVLGLLVMLGVLATNLGLV